MLQHKTSFFHLNPPPPEAKWFLHVCLHVLMTATSVPMCYIATVALFSSVKILIPIPVRFVDIFSLMYCTAVQAARSRFVTSIANKHGSVGRRLSGTESVQFATKCWHGCIVWLMHLPWTCTRPPSQTS